MAPDAHEFTPRRNAETLYPYQVEGVKWLFPRRFALLADEMGLGKTAQAIVAADICRANNIFIVCPAIARDNWAAEWRKFGRPIPGTNARRQFYVARNNKMPPVGSIICSYENLTEYVKEGYLKNRSFDLVILDEAHYLKNLEAKRTLAVFGQGGIARRSKRTWAITGTPMPNHPGELWIMLVCFGIVQMGYQEFMRRYCEFAPGYRINDRPRPVGLNVAMVGELRELLKKIMLRRSVREVLPDLPPLHWGDIMVEAGEAELPQVLRDRLEAEEESVKSLIQDKKVDAFTFRHLEAMAKSVSTLRLYSGLQKINPVVELVSEELRQEQYKKVVIFAVHREVVTKIAEGLSKYGARVIFGGTTDMDRQEHIRVFQADSPKCRVLVCNIRAAGTAITLTAANQVIFAESEWSPEDNFQAAKRCHRIGQLQPVFVRMVGVRHTVDEKVTRILRRKARDIRMVLSPREEEAWATPLQHTDPFEGL